MAKDLTLEVPYKVQLVPLVIRCTFFLYAAFGFLKKSMSNCSKAFACLTWHCLIRYMVKRRDWDNICLKIFHKRIDLCMRDRSGHLFDIIFIYNYPTILSLYPSPQVEKGTRIYRVGQKSSNLILFLTAWSAGFNSCTNWTLYGNNSKSWNFQNAP